MKHRHLTLKKCVLIIVNIWAIMPTIWNTECVHDALRSVEMRSWCGGVGTFNIIRSKCWNLHGDNTIDQQAHNTICYFRITTTNHSTVILHLITSQPMRTEHFSLMNIVGLIWSLVQSTTYVRYHLLFYPLIMALSSYILHLVIVLQTDSILNVLFFFVRLEAHYEYLLLV